jgi:hypothetical protein
MKYHLNASRIRENNLIYEIDTIKFKNSLKIGQVIV